VLPNIKETFIIYPSIVGWDDRRAGSCRFRIENYFPNFGRWVKAAGDGNLKKVQ